MKAMCIALFVTVSLSGLAMVGGKIGLNSLKNQVATKSQQTQAKQSAEMKALLAML